MRIGLTQTLMVRVDGVASHSFADPPFTNLQLHAGMSLMIGSEPLVDGDGDRIYDRYDDCAETPLGALVDKRGCPTDRDGDAVPDGLDRCPGSVAGASVDAVGCTSDSDGDGYLDGLDQCPDTPAGAIVDGRGCPGDADRDGVFDGVDRCPASPAGAAVDALGCPEDADADGVPDGVDQCAGSPQGPPVDARGCPAVLAADSVGERNWVVPGTAWQLRGAELNPSAQPVLDSIATSLRSAPALQAEINAYAHDRLVPSDNTRLSQQRAEVVRAYLVSRGIAAARLTAVGRGSQTLLVQDTTEAARTANRRIEIRVKKSP
jgi:OOP family OmpA-OmpF porin